MMRFWRDSFTCYLAACSVFAATTSIKSEDEPVAAKAKIKLPEDVEKALAELVTKAAKIKRELRMEEMKKIIAEISEITKISDEQKNKLEAEVKPTVERSLVPWKEAWVNRFRTYLSNEGAGALAYLSRTPAEALVIGGLFSGLGKPEEDAGWKGALKMTLTIEQYGALANIAAERERKFNEQIADYLKAVIKQTRQARAALLANEIEDMKQLLKLPDDRVKQLEKIAVASSERACDLSRKRATEALAAMTEQQRAQCIASGSGLGEDEYEYEDEDEDEDEDEAETDESSQGIWLKGVASVLKDDESKRLETAVEERSDRIARAVAMMFVAEMDPIVLFSSEQRGKLEPIAAKTLAEWSKKKSSDEAVSPAQAGLFNADEVKAVLDSGQWERWEAAGRGENRRMMRRAGREVKEDAPAAQKEKQDLPDDETLFATFLDKSQTILRQEMSGTMGAKLDDVRRVVKLSPDRLAYLELAAKGAVEYALEPRRERLKSWARQSMRGAKGEALRTRLADLNIENFEFGDEGTPDSQELWKDALAEALTAEQKNKWGAALVTRETYRQHAYAWVIMAELNRRYRLNNDQFGKLEPLVETAVVEYRDDFMNVLGNYKLIPRILITLFMAVPEDASRSILNASQWKQWKEVDSKYVESRWESMKSNHQRKILKIKPWLFRIPSGH